MDYMAAQNMGMGAQIGGTGIAEQAKRAPEVPMETDRLDKALAFAEESMRELLNRLEPVLRPQAPSTAGANEKIGPVGPSTGVGQRLNGLGQRAGELGERVKDALRRLEL